jgi:hypothetical protein
MKQQEESFYKTINTADIKSQYGDSFLELSRILELYDPMELLIYDIEGEYDPEVASILVQLNKDLTKQEVHDLVYNDFTYWFKPVAGDKEKYKELSDALYNWMLKADLPQKFNT